MTTKQKRVMTWSLRIQDDDYRHDIERYGNKITSIGFHEFDVDAQGRIAIYRLGPKKDEQGSFTSWTDATTYDRYASGRTLWPNYIEKDMKRWPHIEYYMQFVIFGPETVSRLLDSQTAQDNFINNLKTVVARFRKDKNGNDLGYTGIEIDCEGSFNDSKWDTRAGDDVKYINLLKRIKNEVIIDANPGWKLRINAHAMWGNGIPDYYRFHNYKLFAESTDKNGNPLIDEVQIMTYDFSWSGSAPGPSTPLWWMRNVADWVKQNFDPSVNPNAKCTIDNVYLGGAGYGRRWPIHSDDNWGTTVTYRDLVDWQNGYLIHHLGDGQLADQDFIPLNAFNDPNSDNQIMLMHQYDYFKARHMKRYDSMGQTTVRVSEYNGIEYATAYSKTQHAKISGLAGVTGVKGVSEPTHNLSPYDNPKRGETVTIDFGNGQSYTFQAYQTKRVPYVPTAIKDEQGNITGYACRLSKQPETVLTYTLNVPQAGTYRIGAIVSFPFYNYTKLGGHINGTPFTIGGDNLPDYYPMMFKACHIWDLGTHSLNAGANTITIEGPMSKHGTIVFGFFACQSLTLEVIGGYMDCESTIYPYKKRDGSDARMPSQFALTSEVLQQSPRPVIMWEDVFRQYLNDEFVQQYGLEATTYYRLTGQKKDYGGGTIEEWTDDVLTGCYALVDNGFTQGHWPVETDENDTACARFRPNDPKNNGVTSGQLVLNYTYKTTNISCEVQFKVKSGRRAGIRFASTGPGDGYVFLIDYQTQEVMMFYETAGSSQLVASASLGDRRADYDELITLKVLVNNGKCRCYFGNVMFFMNMDLPHMSPGGIGFVATNCDAYLYKLSIGTTERWETLERFSVIIDGQEYKMGEISRPGINRDQWGFLIYSGLNEYNTREVLPDGSRPEISLDYVFKPIHVPSWTGKKKITIKLIDAGLWYKRLYIGDANGMSIAYAGDEESFDRAMNIAVHEYGCKGIGLWALGQADPRIFETLPDVVPWHPDPNEN